MAEVTKQNIKGSTLIETLFAMIIVSLAFGYGITFLSNKPFSNNLNSYVEILELRKLINTKNLEQESPINDYHLEELVFRDSLCFIQKIALNDSSERSLINIKPIVK